MSLRPLVESWLYPLGGMATLELSPDNVTWYEFTFTTPMTVQDALAWWGAASEGEPAVSDVAMEFDYDTGRVTIDALDARVYGRWSVSLAAGLGWATTFDITPGPPVAGAFVPTMICVPFNVDYDPPRPMEVAQLREYRHGRAEAWVQVFGSRKRLYFGLDLATADDVLDGPLFGGRLRAWVTDVVAPYDVDQLDGYHDVDPYSVADLATEAEPDGDAVVILDAGVVTT